MQRQVAGRWTGRIVCCCQHGRETLDESCVGCGKADDTELTEMGYSLICGPPMAALEEIDVNEGGTYLRQRDRATDYVEEVCVAAERELQ